MKVQCPGCGHYVDSEEHGPFDHSYQCAVIFPRERGRGDPSEIGLWRYIAARVRRAIEKSRLP